MKIVVIGDSSDPSSPPSSVTTVTSRWRRHRPWASARSPARDWPQSSEGASVVVDVSNSPALEDAAVLKFFETSTRNLLAAEGTAGVGHYVALSSWEPSACPECLLPDQDRPRES
jgi:hypothetical protein